MIVYDPGTWSVGFAFQLRGSVFPKAVVWALPCSLMSILLHQLFHHVPYLAKLAGAGDAATNVLSGFTFILGFLVVFRSQQAYSRWWEGGTLLQQLRGEWFNSYSCLVAFCNGNKEKREEVRKFQHQMVRLFSLLYGCALQQVSTLEEKKFELIDIQGLNEASLKFLQDSPDRCEVVLQWIQRLIVESEASAVLKIAPPILSRVFNELGNGIVNLNNARKITEFPIPFPLAQMITVMLLFHAVVTPVICAATVDTYYWCGAITFVVTFAYWSINYIAVELEMPFGDDDNDLPLYAMQTDFNGSLKTLIDERSQRVPNFAFIPEEHENLSIRVVDFNRDLVEYKDPAFASAPSLSVGSISPSRRMSRFEHHPIRLEEQPTASTAVAIAASQEAVKERGLAPAAPSQNGPSTDFTAVAIAASQEAVEARGLAPSAPSQNGQLTASTAVAIAARQEAVEARGLSQAAPSLNWHSTASTAVAIAASQEAVEARGLAHAAQSQNGTHASPFSEVPKTDKPEAGRSSGSTNTSEVCSEEWRIAHEMDVIESARNSLTCDGQFVRVSSGSSEIHSSLYAINGGHEMEAGGRVKEVESHSAAPATADFPLQSR